MKTPTRIALTLLFLCLPLAACGGSSGGGTTPTGGLTPAIFNGPYFINALEWSTTATSGRTTWGTWTADGVSNFAATWDENRDGTVTTGNSNPTNTFTVGATGTFNVAFPPLTGDFYSGGISSNGDVAVFAQTRALTAPYIGMAIRKTGAHSNAELNGAHHYVGWVKDVGINTGFFAVWGKVGYDGAGAFSGADTVSFNQDGAIMAGLGPVAGTYTVAADGTMTAETNVASNPLKGGVLGSGVLVHMTGDTSSAQLESMLTFPVGAGLSNATLNGIYRIAGITQDLTEPGTLAFSGSVVANGAGGLTYVTTENFEGNIGPASGPDTYTVAADGTISGSGGARMGAVSPDGRFAFLAGETGAGDDPFLVWMVRQ